MATTLLFDPGFQASVIFYQPFGHLQFKNGVSTKTGKIGDKKIAARFKDS